VRETVLYLCICRQSEKGPNCLREEAVKAIKTCGGHGSMFWRTSPEEVQAMREQARNRSNRFAHPCEPHASVLAASTPVCLLMPTLDGGHQRILAGAARAAKRRLQPCARLHFQLPLFSIVLDTHRDYDVQLGVAGNLVQVSSLVRTAVVDSQQKLTGFPTGLRRGTAGQHLFDEDRCCAADLDGRIRQRTAASNFAVVRRLALNLAKQEKTETSIAKKRFAAALDTDFLEKSWIYEMLEKL
jgi:hypothetical protein